ncbi:MULTISPECIES: Na/Pi cotransporter family protein [Clostridia]|uniref:Na/Pi cotransporter family protein n=1 Tax=Clostridia TaxID=186801 RepID=UPI000EADF552|nr:MULTISPECIES: Na/Pi cotransporter family protein [Clostridia]RKQ31792.1 Na/Pi cotransporter family protein [Ruminococcus sp. B05]TAP36031.1 Na/Pi cotransporter family protein [Mediterraneibacter sp. gm002]
MNEKLQIVFGLVGGLAIFIYGMNMMSECLQKAAGEKMKSILALLTRNPVLGVLAGAITTAVLQSSSATTVMAIGFVSAGLMSLPQAISIIFGANIGTTMTAQIIAFKITDYIYIIIFIGFIISFVAKSEKVKSIGQTIFAFGLLFLGIETMGDVMKPLASSPIFTDLIAKVSNMPVLGVAVGTLMTLVVQSSSATIAVLQNFAAQAGPDGVTSILGLTGAIPILLGDNIGTTITALLASIGQNKDAKRTAVAHCIFNVSGCLLFIWFIKPFAALIQYISPKGPEIEVISRQIANSHTVFNITMTLIWVCLINVMVKIVMTLIPDGKAVAVDPAKPLYLDEKMTNQPTAALQLVAKEILHISDIVKDAVSNTIELVKTEDISQLEGLLEKGKNIKALTDKTTEYLALLFSSGTMTEQQAAQTASLMYILSDVERMGSLSVEIAKCIREKEQNKYKYTPEAMDELQKSLRTLEKMFIDSMKALQGDKSVQIDKMVKRKDKIMDLDIKMRKAHLQRVNKGKCKASLTAPFTNILHLIDRMGNSCLNLADVATNEISLSYFMTVN